MFSHLFSAAVEVTPMKATPTDNNAHINFHTDNAVLSRNDPLHFSLKSYPLGINTYSESLLGMRQDPHGTTVLILFNGEQRIYLRKIDSSPLTDGKLYYQKSFRKYLSTKIAKELVEGKNSVTAIALNSYGESVKTTASIHTKIVDYGKRVPRNKKLENKIQEPYLLYNEPTGNFMKGEAILLDFVVMNASLSPKGSKVVVKIDGVDVATLSQETPHKITNLPRGHHLIKLTLIDSKGRPYRLPFKSQEKSITVQ